MSNGLVAPVLSQVTYTGSLILANFTYSDSQQTTFQIALFEGSSSTPSQTAPSGALSARLINPQMNTTSVWLVKIAATSGSDVGPYSNAIAVIVGPPQNITVADDGGAVALVLTWTPPAGATVAYGATVSLYNATHQLIDNQTFKSSPAIFRPIGGLDPAVSYYVRLGGATTTNSFGPNSSEQSVIQPAPSFSRLDYSVSGDTSAIVANSATVDQNYLLALYLYSDGALYAEARAGAPGNFVRMTLNETLDPAFTWTARLAYTLADGTTRGPFSSALAVVVEPASITGVSYDGTTVGATWNNGVGSPPATGAYYGITDAGGTTVSSGEVLGTSASIVPSPPLTDNTPYKLFISAQRGPSLGPAGSPVDILTWLPSPSATVTYDGANIVVKWTAIGGSDVKGMNVALLNNGTVTQTQPGGNLETTIAAALSPSGKYDVALQTTGDRTTGPFGTSVPVISVVPRVTGATYSTSGAASRVVVTWNASEISRAHGLTGYSVQLYEDDAPLGDPVPVNDPETGTATLNVATLLDPSKTHAVTVQAVGTKSAGPAGTQSPIITASPEFVSIEYDGTNVIAAWTAVAQQAVSGYRVTVDGTHHNTALTTITFAYSGATNPSISIHALGAAATGPTVSTTLLTASVTMQSTSYDGAILNVTWSASTASPAYIADVLQGSGVVASQTTTALQATLPVALSTAIAYSVAVRGSSADGKVIGPKSTAAMVVVATPAISNVAWDGTNVTGNVTAPGGVTLDTSTIKVSLYANGIAAGSPVSASNGTFTIPASGTASSGLTVRAELTGTKSNVAVSGPFSPDVPVLTATPVIDSALLAASGATWKLTVAWSLPESDPSVGKFTVVLKQAGAALETWTTSGTSLSVTAPAFDSSKSLELTVTPNGNYGNGPASAEAKFHPTAIASRASVVDGDRVTVSWTDDAGKSFDAYRLRLVQSTGDSWLTIAQSEALTGRTGFVQVPSPLIETDAVYGITVDVATGNAWTASNAVDDIIVQSPTITSASSTSSSAIQIEWDAPSAPSGITNYLPVMIWEAGELALDEIANTPTTATIAIPSLVPNGAWITLSAIKSAATGPVSNSMAFVSGVPSGLAVAYDGTNISATWNASDDARVSAYRVTFTPSGTTPVVETVNGTSWSKAFTPTAGQTANVSVALVAGISRGIATTAVDAILNQPSITKAAFDGTNLTLTWSAVTDSAANAYVINVMSGGSVIAAYTSGGTSATIPFAASADTIQIRAIGASTSGPISTSFTPVTATPNVTSIAFDTSGSLKIDWDAIGTSAYSVVFRMANAVVLTKPATTNTITILKADLPAAGIYDVTVQASSANNDISGPISAPLPAVVLPPPNVAIAYDGRTARVTWEPIASPSITGYLVTVLNGTTAVVTQTTVGPSAAIAVAYASANNYDVVVQALTSAGKGQPSSTSALFQAGWYPSTASDKTSYIQPAKAAAMAGYDIDVYLPNLFTTYVSSGLPTAQPFVFATTDPPFAYKLTMQANSGVWSFTADAIRSTIYDAYQTLLANLVTLNVTPLGWRMVQDAISRAMPQTFAESLYYGYAFTPGSGYIDLKPGMLLRADFETYQYLGPDQTVSEFVDGFVSSSSAVYDVGSYVTAGDAWLTGFDAFLSLITQTGSTVPPPQTSGSTSSGGGGIVDLYYSQFRRPYVRLVYPPTLLGDRTAEARTAFNVAVLAANDYPTLNTATANLRNAQPLPNGVAATYLRGRTTISACIRIWLDGQPLVVPVGSSVGNVLETMGRRPPIVIPQTGGGAPGIPLSGITLERSIGYAVTNPADATSGYPVSKGTPIRLDWNKGMAYSAATDWINLPLLPGDRINTRGNE